MLWKPNWMGTALWINVLRKHPLMYLAGNYCYRIDAIASPGVLRIMVYQFLLLDVHESMASRQCSYLHDL